MKNSLTFFAAALFSILFTCCATKQSSIDTSALELLKAENEKLKASVEKNKLKAKNEIATFLTFQDDQAETAMNFYIELFDNSKVIQIKRWEAGGPGTEGKIMHASFELNGSLFMCSDSPPIHAWGFTPAVSNFIECENDSVIEKLFKKLSENGTVMMPLNNYGFSQKFGFVVDQFGVSWQLNLQ